MSSLAYIALEVINLASEPKAMTGLSCSSAQDVLRRRANETIGPGLV
jgi:hypothetical protein